MKMEEAFFSASNCLECHACAFVQPPFEKLTSLQFFILYIFPIFRQTNDFFFFLKVVDLLFVIDDALN